MPQEPTELELMAFEIIERATGDEVEHHDRGGTNQPDGVIKKEGRVVAALEVLQVTNEAHMRDRRESAEPFEVSGAKGAWLCRTPLRGEWRQRRSDIEHVVHLCHREGMASCKDLANWPDAEVQQRWSNEGRSVRLANDDPSRDPAAVFLVEPNRVGSSDEQLETLSPFVASLFEHEDAGDGNVSAVIRKKVREHAGKAKRPFATERHLFLFIDRSVLPQSLSLALGHTDHVPASALELPDEFADLHVWVGVPCGRNLVEMEARPRSTHDKSLGQVAVLHARPGGAWSVHL